MKTNKFLKRILGKKTKTGASLLVVLIAVTLLIVMGSTFSMIAMTAYNNSQRRLCQQQAYYTAEACLNILSTQFANDINGTYMTDIKSKIATEFNKGTYANVSDVLVTVAVLKDPEGNDGVISIPTNGLEASLLGIVGGCTIEASAVEGTKTTDSISAIKLIATGTYKGYSQTVTARMAVTTKGSIELKKIFSNSQCWSTPVVTLIAGETTGDMYFTSPGTYYRWPNGEIRLDSTPIPGVPNETYKSYNEKIRTIYGNVASGNTLNTGAKVHTRPFGFDNKPLKTPAMRCIPAKDIEDIEKLITYNYPVWGTGIGGYTNDRENYRIKVQNQKIADVNSKISTLRSILEAEQPTMDMEYSNFYDKTANHGKFLGANGESFMYATRGYYKHTEDWFYPNVHGWDDYDEWWYAGVDFKRSPDFIAAYPYPVGDNIWYNDWVEIYMFTGQHGVGQPSIVDGDMYVNTKALIGLYDKDKTQLHYWQYRDYITERDKVEKKFVSYGSSEGEEGHFDDNLKFYRDLYRNGYEFGPSFEHGGTVGEDLFFDYYKNKPPAYNQSVMSHNGNMYLFDDARIECYDSTHTANATKGVKNNIFAHKNLVIDGSAMDPIKDGDIITEGLTEITKTSKDKTILGSQYVNPFENNIYTKRNVSIYGDVMVEGALMITDATIYGDVYCNGSQLYLADCEIYGNVYYNGTKLVADNVKIRGDEKTMRVNADGSLDTDSKGKLKDRLDKPIDGYSFQADNGHLIRLNGGDLVILGNGATDKQKYNNDVETGEKDGYGTDGYGKQAARFEKDRDDRDKWGVRLTNCNVSGTLFSEVNVAINSMYRRIDDYKDADGVLKRKRSYKGDGASVIDGSIVEDQYNNIVVNAELLFDMREKYRNASTRGDINYLVALVNNGVRVKGLCMADRMQLVQTQAGDMGEDFLGNYTRYETRPGETNESAAWIKKPHRPFANYGTKENTTRIERWSEYNINYIADKKSGEGKESKNGNVNDPNYRCSNIHIGTMNIGDGGFYIDGSAWYYEGAGDISGSWYWYGEQNTSGAHTSVIVDNIYCTTNLRAGSYKRPDGQVKDNVAAKITLKNIGGKPKNSTEYNKVNFYTPLPYAAYFPGEESNLITFHNDVSQADIRIAIYQQVHDLIKKEIENRETNSDATKPGNGTKANVKKYEPPEVNDKGSMAAIADVMREYYMKVKAPHRINSYYNALATSMGLRGYKEIGDVRTWASNKKGEGPYPMYDPQATDGVWRQIKMLAWSAPSSITPKAINGDGTSPVASPVTFDKVAHECYYTSTVVGTNGNLGTAIPDIENYIYHDENGNMVVTGNILSDKQIYVPDGKKLIFDSSRNNLHCTLHGGLILGKNAQVVLRGGNMTFLYMVNDNASQKLAPEKAGNIVLGMDEGSVIGVVDNTQEVENPADSLYIVSNDLSLIHMKTMAQIKGFIYAPEGYIRIDEYKYDADGNKVYNAGTVNTVLHGSLVVRSFIVDMTATYDQIHGMYKNLKYEYVMAPLICDTNIDFGDNPGQIGDYQTPQWGFIGYD